MFGLSCSPFLANRTIIQLIHDEGKHFPLAAEVLKNYIYVDDILVGTDTLSKAISIQNQLIKLLAKAGFELRKWSSNNPKFLEGLPISHLYTQSYSFNSAEDTSIKILGLQWKPLPDCFTYNVKISNNNCTKRSILSDLARIYDPLGFLTPNYIFCKALNATFMEFRLRMGSNTTQ